MRQGGKLGSLPVLGVGIQIISKKKLGRRKEVWKFQKKRTGAYTRRGKKALFDGLEKEKGLVPTPGSKKKKEIGRARGRQGGSARGPGKKKKDANQKSSTQIMWSKEIRIFLLVIFWANAGVGPPQNRERGIPFVLKGRN